MQLACYHEDRREHGRNIRQLPHLEGWRCKQAGLAEGERSDPAAAWGRSSRPTLRCFLSPGHWKAGIMRTKDKAPKFPNTTGNGGSRFHTISRREGRKPPRHQARKGKRRGPMAVFVLDKHQKPLMPCSESRTRLLLERATQEGGIGAPHRPKGQNFRATNIR